MKLVFYFIIIVSDWCFCTQMKVSSDTNSSIIKSTSYNWPVLTLSVFSIFGILGNILVCLTIKRDQDLQTKTNFYLFSLAFADLAVCLIVIPLSIIQDFSSKSNYLNF